MSFFDDDGVQRSLPRAWTDAADLDPFVVLAAGRSPFRVEDLVALADLVAELRDPHSVKTIMPLTVRLILPPGLQLSAHGNDNMALGRGIYVLRLLSVRLARQNHLDID